jgi:tetratricopeptide (TPR) repeat protein
MRRVRFASARVMRGAVCLGTLVAASWLVFGGAARADRDAERTIDARATYLFEQDRIPEAIALLDGQLAKTPEARTTRLLAGEYERRRCNLAVADAHFDSLLTRDPADPDALAGKGEILLLLGQPAQGLALTKQALASERGKRSGTAWRVHALALVDVGQYPAALEASAQAARLLPDDPRAHEARARAAFRSKRMDLARAAYMRAAELDPLSEEAHLRLGSGFGHVSAGRPWTRKPDAEVFAAAVAAWDAARLGDATTLFGELVARRPKVFKYRLGLGLTRRAVREYYEVRFGGDAAKGWLQQPAPAVPELPRYIRGWTRLPPWAQKSLQISVGPARRWMPQLLRAGASHEILHLPDSLDDAPSRRHLATRRTFDGRLYAHIRGVGGVAAATGIEKLRAATSFGFNTFAHEFAHQLLRQAFPANLRKQVDTLYKRARSEGRCLDYYAASNVDEYFAQGYEALVSHVKRGCQRDTARHTRKELQEKDPAFYAFLVQHLELGHETEDAMAPFWRAVPP